MPSDDNSYPTHGWGALAADPWMPVGADGPEYREILRRIWLRQGGTDEVFEVLMPPKPARDGSTYPPEAIRVLEGMTPPRRPAGFVEDAPDPEWLVLPSEERAAALDRAMSQDGDGEA